MTNSKALLVSLGALALFASSGCVTPNRAIPAASLRSGCPAEKIKVVESDGDSAVLDVCGQRQAWEWHPFNGYGYAGKPATPRTAER